MKKTLLTIALGLAMALTAANVQALTLDLNSTQYLGSVDPGAPASVDDEVIYVNNLIDLAPNAATVVIDGHSYDRDDGTCGACPDATAVGSVGSNTGGPVNLTSANFTYLLAKYGNISYVWYVAGLTSIQLNSDLSPTLTGDGLSHYQLFNPGTITTPDGGTTLGLLGLGMLGLGYLRRRIG